MRYIFSILILFISYSTFSQDFQWAKQFGNTKDDRIIATEVDNNGNTYLLGESTSYLFDLNPNQDEEIINNNTNHGNLCFIVKLDENGEYIWGKIFNNSIRTLYDRVIDIKIGTDNNIYTLIQVYNYTGNQNITDAQNLIVKLDANGNELFVKSVKNLLPQSSNNQVRLSTFDLDSLNNIFIGGYFFGTSAVLDLSNPQFNLTSTGGSGIFVFKMDNNGNFLWKFNPSISSIGINKIKIRPDGNLNVLYNSTYTPNVCRLVNLNSSNGTILWEKNYDNIFFGVTFETANNGNIMISCKKSQDANMPVDVDTSSNTLFTTANLFLLCLNSNGDFITIKEYFTNNILINIVKTDTNSNFYVAGNWTGYAGVNIINHTFDADPSINTFLLTTHPSQWGEGFIIKFNDSFIFENAFKLGQPDIPPTPYSNIYLLRFTDIKFNGNNKYYTGYFSGFGDLNPTIEVTGFETLHGSVTLNNDGFIIKIGECDTATPLGNSIQTFCSSQNPTISNLTPNSGIIKWYSSSTSTTHLPSATPLVNGTTYYASNQSGTCPESITRLEVTVNITQSPSSPIANNQSFCDNENATLNNINVTGQNLTWYDINNNQISNNTILQNNTTYYVSQTINGCESNKAPVLILVYSTPIPLLISPQQFCIQENAIINNIQITGQNILWYDTQTSGNLIPTTTVLQNGITYYASQTINGCESDRVPVTIVIQNTTAPTGNGNQSFCSTANATLSNIILNGSNIIWYDLATNGNVLPSSTLLAHNTTYFATQTVNNCESPTRLAITISLINTLNATNYSESICDDLNNGTETVNLTNYNSNLIASANNTFSYYISSNGAENQISSEEILNPTNYNLTLGNQIIYVRIDSPNTCHQIVELNLTLFSKPILNINDVMPICEGSSITISAGNGFDNYLWSTNEITPSITIFQAGNYSVTVSENHGSLICSTTKNFSVVNSNIGTISEIITSDWTANENTISVLLTTNSNGVYEYSLNGIDYQDNSTFTNLENGEYTVYVRDKNGCGVNSEEIYLLMHPKYFTPNGDGYNDFWKIKFSENEPNLTVKIFDRYGKFIKELDSNSIGWDGTYLGKKTVSNDYWFLVIRENGKEHRGHFSLIR